MKRTALVAALAALAACGPRKEKEPNDHFTQAQSLGRGAKVHGTVGSASDVDVYRVEARGRGVLWARVGGIRDVDFVLSVQDRERNELKRYDEKAEGGDELAVDVGVEEGPYYLALSNKNPKADNPGQTYALEVRIEDADGNEREPNDRALLATPMEPGTVMRGHYHPTRNLLAADQARAQAQEPPPPGPESGPPPEQGVEASSPAVPSPAPSSAPPVDDSEEDWFRLDVKQEGMFVLNLDVTEVPGVDAVLEVYDLNSYKIKEADAGGPGEPESLKNFGLRGPVQYFLRLRAKSRSTGSPDIRYEIVTELLPYQGSTEFEPNDQRLEATPMLQDSMTGTIASDRDADWYKVEAQEEGRRILTASLTPAPGMDLVLQLRDDLGNALLTVDNAGKEQPEVLTGFGLGRGDHYLVVSEKTGRRSDARRSYTLARTLAPYVEGLEYELNDSSSTAQPLKVGSSVDGYVAPKGDADWYEFNVYQQGTIVAEATGVLNVRLGAALYDQDGRELGAATGRKPGEGVTLSRELEPGTYWLRLRPEDPAHNNIRDKYTLRLRAQ